MQRPGKPPVSPNEIRRGVITRLSQNGDFGLIIPDSSERGRTSTNKQWIFFHVTEWAGCVSTVPTQHCKLPIAVKYVRMPSTKDRTKWCAVKVSRLR